MTDTRHKHPAPHGWLILDKPRGLGSTQVVGAVKRNLREGGYAKTKVGHGGTLDPQAEGVLPIALGEATKLAGRMLDASKIYEFTIQFGELTLDESLIARERISSNLQRTLDEMTNDWGLKVCKVEIRLIDPPDDIKRAMHKQKTAEQERRAMKLLATGKYEAAEQEKLAAIQIAEGQKEADIMVAEGKAKSIQLVNEAAEKYFVGNAKDLKKLETTEACLKENSKVVLTEKGITPQIILGDIPMTAKKAD